MILNLLLLHISAYSLSQNQIEFLKSKVNLMAASYNKAQDINARNCKDCASLQNMINVTVYSTKNNIQQWFVGYLPSQNEIVLSIRGSSNIRNWFENILQLKQDMKVIPQTKVPVQRPFLRSSIMILKSVEQSMKDLLAEHPGARFSFLGHSSGGAKAILCAVLALQGVLKNVDPALISVITAGSPAVGNWDWVEYYEKLKIGMTFRISNYNDVVATLPPDFLGFRHAGTEVLIYNDEYIVCGDDERLKDERYEKGSCFNRYKWFQLLPKFKEVTPNHRMYLDIQVSGRKTT